MMLCILIKVVMFKTMRMMVSESFFFLTKIKRYSFI